MFGCEVIKVVMVATSSPQDDMEVCALRQALLDGPSEVGVANSWKVLEFGGVEDTRLLKALATDLLKDEKSEPRDFVRVAEVELVIFMVFISEGSSVEPWNWP